MTYEHISALLEKYWEGESTLEEERTLKAYFASGRVEEPFRQWMPMFQALQTEQGIQYTGKASVAEIRPQQYRWQAWAVAASLALTLIAGSWWYFNRTTDIQDVVQTPVSQPKPEVDKQVAPTPAQVEQPSINGPVTPVPLEEAVAKIEKPKHKLFRKKPTPADSFDDPEQAYAEIKAALALVSSKINRGKNEAAKNINRIDTIDKFFKKKKESQG